ncbi:MAG: O-antigen ligase family protein [Clostridiales bacterium]|nr:O-antigen ligase family protein [Clostridiales bacterium]MCF8021144.1 O-antigen ligase family protein [Clostridiales bacterium]
MKKLTGKLIINDSGVNVKYFIIWFMLAVYPALAIPNNIFIPAGIFFENAEYGLKLGSFHGPRYIMLGLISLTALVILIKDRVNLKSPVYIPQAVFLVLSFIASLNAQNAMFALIGDPDRFTGFSTYFFCSVLFILASTSNRIRDHLTYMTGCAAVVSCIGILQYYGMDIIGLKHAGNYSTLGNPNFLGTYTVFILPAAVFFYMQKGKFTWLLCTGIIYAGLLVSMTRGAWLAFLVSFAVISVYMLKFVKRKYFIHVIITLLLVTCIFLPGRSGLFSKRVSSIPGEAVSAVNLEDKAGSYRVYIWREVLKSFPEYRVIGLGPDNLLSLDIHTPNGSLADKAHNIYLEITATMGIFALASFLIFVFLCFLRWRDETSVLFNIMIFTYLVQGLFNIDVVMVMPVFWILLGLSRAHDRRMVLCRNLNTGL